MRALFLFLVIFLAITISGCMHRAPALRSMYDPRGIKEAYEQLPAELQARTTPGVGRAYPDGITFDLESRVEGDIEFMVAFTAENEFYFFMDECENKVGNIVTMSQISGECTDETKTRCVTVTSEDVLVLRDEPKRARRGVGEASNGFEELDRHFRFLNATGTVVANIVQIVDSMTPDGADRVTISYRVMESLADENGYITYQEAGHRLAVIRTYLAKAPEERSMMELALVETYIILMGM